MSRAIASAAVVVDAKDEKAHKFKDFGFTPFPESKKRLFMPMLTIEQLFTSAARNSKD